MAKRTYSVPLVLEFQARANACGLEVRHPPPHYEDGERLEYDLEGVHPATRGRAAFRVEKFIGGGFAGQVYRVRLEEWTQRDEPGIAGLQLGQRYALKILVPPTAFSRWFRNTIYWLAFQGPFSAQVLHSAARVGALWQKLIRAAAAERWGTPTAVKDIYATFYDNNLRSWGEITEWVEGRRWRLEADPQIRKRWRWQTVDLAETGSPEYVAKRRFMAQMVQLLHEMGAPEFARQYEWYTLKSQPNVIKRTDIPDAGASAGLCAIDFRAGLALLPFLPMSPADVVLIARGLRRGAWVQFDRGDLTMLREFVARHEAAFTSYQEVLRELITRDREYRRSLPDLTHHGIRWIYDAELRREIRAGLVQGYLANGLADEAFAAALREGGGLRFAAWYLLGAIPLLGRFIRRLWGNAAYRKHWGQLLTSADYLRRAFRANAFRQLARWHRRGRIGEERARRLSERPVRFAVERLALGWLPFARLHRAIMEPRWALERLRERWRAWLRFVRDADYREQWFLDLIAAGEKNGMLTEAEAATIRRQVRDPFIIKYLKCLGVHVATLPVTQVVSVSVGAAVAGWMLFHGRSWGDAALAFGGIVAIFQVLPISPGSICRGGFVVYLMIRERNFRDYIVAAPLSFVKYVGYLAFPLQMAATYPQLARFMAAQWATSLVHYVPVFGEPGALLEHWVFDLFFNIPLALGRWARPRIRGLLTAWAILGVSLGLATLRLGRISPTSPAGVNIALAVLVLFVMPRLVFYPLFRRTKRASEHRG